MKKKFFLLALLCFITGFTMISIYQFQIKVAEKNPTNHKNESLVNIINNLESEIAANQEELLDLNKKIEEYEKTLTDGEYYTKKLQENLRHEKFKAGLVPLTGPGIKVIVDDNTQGLQAKPNEDPNNYIIHYENILSLVEDLKRAGSEAISINDQRLVTNSEIRCVGNVIMINTSRLAPPFEISAIGNPQILENYLLNSNEYQYLLVTGFPISYKVFNEDALIEIPEYRGTFSLEYSKNK